MIGTYIVFLVKELCYSLTMSFIPLPHLGLSEERFRAPSKAKKNEWVQAINSVIAGTLSLSLSIYIYIYIYIYHMYKLIFIG